ncbi:MAG: NADH-quinone oxidoreductase subunit D [Spirochaetes bacterium]|nr:NADH-quinone oxidoreductase subunit D [Spirochaetota bacterium]
MMDSKFLEINMGPQHPSTHGVLNLKLSLDNEVVVKVEPNLGYLHRGMEKLWENRTYAQVVPFTDRLDYFCAISNNLGYVLAVEKLMGLEIPKRAQYIRVILTEIQRIVNHIGWLGFVTNDAGAYYTINFYTFEEREEYLEIFEEYVGARLTINAIRIGGVPFDIDDKLISMIEKALVETEKKIKDIDKIVTRNRIWLHRTKGVGVFSAEDAVQFGLTGPALRASGVKWDIRKDIPYSSYDEFDFDVPTGTAGDIYDRYLVRVEEIKQSMRIIRQAIKNLPSGEIAAKVPKVLKIPEGEIFHSIEAPKGELGFYIKSNGTDKPERVKMKSPSFINMQSLESMCKGNMLADVVVILGSLDVLLGEIDK